MLHKHPLRNISVRVPGLSQQIGDLVIGFINRNPCACVECEALKRKMRNAPITEFSIGITAATTIMQALRLQRSDYCLELAGRICHEAGIAITSATVCSRVLHKLEQGQAYTREQIRMERLRFWFTREWINAGIEPGDRFSRLVDEARLLLASNEFPVLDEAGFAFDQALRARIATLAHWMSTQIK